MINISNKSMTYSVAKGNTICFSTWTHIDTRWNYKLWCCPPHCNNPTKRKHLGVLDLKIWDLKCSIFILFLFSGWKRAVLPCSIKPKNASCWKINPERLFSKGNVSSHLLLLASISQETTNAHETTKSHTTFLFKNKSLNLNMMFRLFWIKITCYQYVKISKCSKIWKK